MIPYFDHPLCGAGEENGGDEWVPADVVDGRVVGGIGLQESRAVLGRALVNNALVRPDQKHGVVIRVERHATTAIWWGKVAIY